MKPTQEESAELKRRLDSATPLEREAAARNFPLEFDEWHAERKRGERREES